MRRSLRWRSCLRRRVASGQAPDLLLWDGLRACGRMDLDVERLLGAEERSVPAAEREGQAARAVTVARGYAATVEDLWDAVPSAERIPRWFLPGSGSLPTFRSRTVSMAAGHVFVVLLRVGTGASP